MPNQMMHRKLRLAITRSDLARRAAPAGGMEHSSDKGMIVPDTFAEALD
ncbi:hypothetical protein RSSM_03083 [Rhodopirellula sallentina SM41]|uniref:Uncharacterized protein n=1 Tax=Rhodopirellula sallentina SM41 TaxID=1263870 RepID=M5U1X7_9BACT|nr:hypothetical protein RSSM_03083 [Rhodopirellula sallentina SM41]